MKVKSFTFNPFSENTYVLYDDTKECVIIDPGCYDESEQEALLGFIEQEGLKPKRLLNTHCHIDHIFGNNLIGETFDLLLEAHAKEVEQLASGAKVASLYAMNYAESPEIGRFISEEDTISFGDTQLEIRFTPGHSPGSIVFLHHDSKTLIGGDVLFFDSIGRTDLPGGDHETLINSIHDQLFVLDDDWTVHCGHGPSTSIGRERRYNPWLRT